MSQNFKEEHIMDILKIPYDRPILISENKNTKQKIYLQKTKFTVANKDHYFLKLVSLGAG